ncbi:MAG: DUF1761 domain-containing protein [Candidatus Dojkabacteria bacterium]
MPSVNIFAVVVAAVLSMVTGFIWYSMPVFGTMWVKLIGKKAEDMNGSSMSYAMTSVGAIVSAVVFAMFVSYLGVSTLVDGLALGALVWVGFTFVPFFTNGIFENKNFKLVLIDSGYFLANFLMMGVLFALWK